MAIIGLTPLSRMSGQDVLSQTVLYDTLRMQWLMHEHAAQLAPTVILVDPHTNTATVTVTNPSDQSLAVDLSLQFYTTQTDAVGQMINTIDSTPAEETPSLIRWIKGVPAHVTLTPHETRKITVQIAIPMSLRSGPNVLGEYWAQLVATSPALQGSLQAVVQQVQANPDGSHTLQQMPANGDLATMPVVTKAQLLYRLGTATSTLQLGTLAAAVQSTGTLQVCVPMHRKGTIGFLGRVRLSVHAEGRDTLLLTRNLDIPAGSASDLQPCYESTLPSGITGQVTAILTVDGERADIPQAARVAIAPVHATTIVTVTLPAPPTPVTSASPSVSVVTLDPKAGPLLDQLRYEATQAAKEGKLTLVEVGAPWCGPCQAFLRSLTDSLMIDALHNARIVQINFNQWGQAFVNGAYNMGTGLPMFFLANTNGTEGTSFDVHNWQALAAQYGSLDARSMAPPLKAFLEAEAQKIRSQP